MSFSGKVVTFTDASPYATASQFSATIVWSDGSQETTGTVSADAETFSFSGADGSGNATITMGAGGAASATVTLSYESGPAGMTGTGDSSAGGSQSASANFSQGGTAINTSTSGSTTTLDTETYTIGEEDATQVSSTGTGTFTVSDTGPTATSQVSQSINADWAATTSLSGTMVSGTTSGDGAEGGSGTTVDYVLWQNSAATEQGANVASISQTGLLSSQSGTLDLDESGYTSGSYGANTSFYSATATGGAKADASLYKGSIGSASSSDTSQGGAASPLASSSPAGIYIAAGVNDLTQAGGDSYSIGLDESYNGSAASGAYDWAVNGSAGWNDAYSANAIRTSSTGGTSVTDIAGSGDSETYVSQGSESFTPTSASEDVTVAQAGGTSFSQDNSETYTESGSALIDLVGGVYPLATVNSGQAVFESESDAGYTDQETASFSPSSSSGTYQYTEDGAEQSTSDDTGVLVATSTGVIMSEGYAESTIQVTSVTYQDAGSFTESGSTGTEVLSASGLMIATSSATEPFAIESSGLSEGGTLSSSDIWGSLTVFSAATSYSPTTTSVTFSESIEQGAINTLTNSYTTTGDGGTSATASHTSFGTFLATDVITGTAINGTTVATDSWSDSGSSGYTDSDVAVYNLGPGAVETTSWGDSETYSWSSSAVTETATSPTGSLISLSQSYGDNGNGTDTYADSDVISTSGTGTSGSLTSSSTSYEGIAGIETLTWTDSDWGTASGPGSSISVSSGFSDSQSLNQDSGVVTSTWGELDGAEGGGGSSATTSYSLNISVTQTYSDSGTVSGVGPDLSVASSDVYTAWEYVTHFSLSSVSVTDGGPSTYLGETWGFDQSSATETIDGGAVAVTATSGLSLSFSYNWTSGAGETVDWGYITNSGSTTLSLGGGTYSQEAYEFSELDTPTQTLSSSASLTWSGSEGFVFSTTPILTQWLEFEGGINPGGEGSASGASSGGGGGSSVWGSSGAWGTAGSAGSSSSSSSSPGAPSSASNNGASPFGGVLNGLGQSATPQLPGGLGVYVPAGILTMQGPGTPAGASAAAVGAAGLITVAEGQIVTPVASLPFAPPPAFSPNDLAPPSPLPPLPAPPVPNPEHKPNSENDAPWYYDLWYGAMWIQNAPSRALAPPLFDFYPGSPFSKFMLRHSFQASPDNLYFRLNDPFTKAILASPQYAAGVEEALKEAQASGAVSGRVLINFPEGDLHTAIGHAFVVWEKVPSADGKLHVKVHVEDRYVFEYDQGLAYSTPFGAAINYWARNHQFNGAINPFSWWTESIEYIVP